MIQLYLWCFYIHTYGSQLLVVENIRRSSDDVAICCMQRPWFLLCTSCDDCRCFVLQSVLNTAHSSIQQWLYLWNSFSSSFTFCCCKICWLFVYYNLAAPGTCVDVRHLRGFMSLLLLTYSRFVFLYRRQCFCCDCTFYPFSCVPCDVMYFCIVPRVASKNEIFCWYASNKNILYFFRH